MLFSFAMLYLLTVVFFYSVYQFYFTFYLMFLFFVMIICSITLEFCGSLNTLFFYIDKMSFLLVVLSYLIILMILVFLYLEKDIFMLFILVFMLLSLSMCFISSNLFLLYIFFEFSLIPLFLMIVFYGASAERFEACVYLLIYTFISSMVFLVVMTFIKNYNIFYLEVKLMSFLNESGVIWFFLMMIFLFKLPLYGTHNWLSKAHVEAPVGGSMLLAGVLLKLGGFGLYRIFFYVNLFSLSAMLNFLIIFSLMGAVFSCVICMRQVDIKLLIAYSSVSHMGLLLAGMLTMSKLGVSGAVAMMLAHGFCSSVLFYIANLYYTRIGSRNMMIMKGMVHYFPGMICFWLVFCLSNMGTPPSFNFMSEILLLIAVFNKSLILLFLTLFYLVMVVYYNLILFLRTGHGQSWLMNFMKKESSVDLIIVLFHAMMIFVYIFKSDLFFV